MQLMKIDKLFKVYLLCILYIYVNIPFFLNNSKTMYLKWLLQY